MVFSFDDWKKNSKKKSASAGMGSFDSWKENRKPADQVEQPSTSIRTFDQFESARTARELDAQGPKSEKARQADADRFARGHVSPKSDQARQADADRFAGRALADLRRQQEQAKQAANDRFAGRAMSDAGLIQRQKDETKSEIPKKDGKANALSRLLSGFKSEADSFMNPKEEESKGQLGMRGIERGAFIRDNENDEFGEKFGANLRLGAGDVVGGLAGVGRWLLGPSMTVKDGQIIEKDRLITKGLDWTSNFLQEGVEGAEYSKDFDFKTAITDPEFYATSVTRAVPQLLTSIVPALGAAKATTMIPKVKDLPKVYRTVIQSLGGAGAATTIDSAIEAGSVYEEAINRGFTEGDANKAANETFMKNFALTGGTTFGEFMLGLSPIGRGLGKLGKTATVAAKTAGGAALEGAQEGAQDWISASALGDDFSWTDPSTIEAMTIGAILGGGVTGGMATVTEVSDTFSKNATISTPMADIIELTVMKLPAPVREQYDNTVIQLQEQGHSFEDAREVALEALAEQDSSIESLLDGTAKEYVAGKKLERQSREGVEVKKDGTVTTKSDVQSVNEIPVQQSTVTEASSIPQLPSPEVQQQQVAPPILPASLPALQESTDVPQTGRSPEPEQQSAKTAEVPITEVQKKPITDANRVAVVDPDTLQNGDMVRLKGTGQDAFVEVIDTSDPSMVKVRNDNGSEYQVGRVAVEEKRVQATETSKQNKLESRNQPITEPVTDEKNIDKKTEAISQTDESIPTNGIDRIGWFRKKMREMDYTAADLKEQFQWLQDNEEQIKKDIYNYIKESSQHKRKREKTKQELVEKTYRNALDQPAYGDTDSLMYNVTFGSVDEQHTGRMKQLTDKINSITDENIEKYLAEKKAERNQKERMKSAPETIKDFIYKRHTVGLTAEEQARLDELEALRDREKQAEKIEAATPAGIIQTGEYTIKPDKDTRDGSDIWVVSLNKRMDSKAYAKVNNTMRLLGGYYSRYKKGFLFKEDPTSKLGGETVESDSVETTDRDAVRIAERLRTMADNMQNTIDAKRNDNRLTNTARRAAQDAYAREEADALERQQGIMRRIADAVESDEAVFLDNVTARTHIETLDRVLMLAKRERMNKKEYTNLNPKEREKIAGQPLTVEEINTIEIPKVDLYPGNVERIVKALTGTKGIGRELARVAKVLNQHKGKDTYMNGNRIREDMLKIVDVAMKNEDVRYYAQSIKESYNTLKRLEVMNLATPQLLRSGIREYIKYVDDVGENVEQKQKDEKRKREAELTKLNIPGFFPTPTKVIDRMLEEADIQPGMTVLEPSAGKGNIAERIRDEHEGAVLDVVEYNNTLNEYLESQDFNVVGADFLSFDGTYDRIIMNPPFEKGQDIDHVRHAYEMLKPGGRVVAIMSEGPFFRSDKKAMEFRDWIDELAGVSEQLDEGSFIDSERTTGVATRLVTIDKSMEKAPEVIGMKGETFTEKGTKIEFAYQLVEADELIASNDTSGKVNPDYPQELQPRDRTRKASQAQIQNIAQKLNPNLLGESAKASDGAPIIGPDNVVESGNGRTIALQKLYTEEMPKESDYRSWLLDNADKYGLDYGDLENMTAPILVRRRTNIVDRQAFVGEANESNVSSMSAAEQAKVDADKMTNRVMHLFNPADNGDLNVSTNRAFISAFIGEVVPQNDRARMMTADGNLSQDGLLRVRNAVFSKAYGDVDAISLIAESTDNNVRTITNAMLQSAPRFAIVKDKIASGDLHGLDITNEIVEAMTQLAELRAEGTDVHTFLKQLSMFDSISDLSKDMLTIFDSKKFKRSTKAVNELFSQYINVLEVAGNPKQESLFGDVVPTKAEILQTALNRVVVDEKAENQIDVFQDEAESVAETGTIAETRRSKEKVSSSSEHVDTFVKTKGSNQNESAHDRSERQNSRDPFREPKGTPQKRVRKEYSQDPGVHDENVTRADITEYIRDNFKVTISLGKTRRQDGIYKNKFAIIRTKEYGDFEVLSHELGHRIDTRIGLSVDPKLQNELVKFAEANLQLPDGMTKIQRAREGVAEWFRQAFYGTHNFDLLTDAELKEVIAFNQVSPELELAIMDGLKKHNWFEPTIELRKMVQSWLGRTPEQEVKGFVTQLGRTRRQRKTVDRYLGEIYTRIFDRDHPFHMANKAVEKELGMKIPLDKNAYALKVLTRGTTGRAATFVEGRTFDKDGNVTGESLESILSDVDDIEEFGQYLAARHAMDLKKNHGKERTPISVDLGADYLDKMSPKYEEQAKRIYAYQERLLQVLVDGGLIPSELPEKLRGKYPNYVPFYREMSDVGVKVKKNNGGGVGGDSTANLQTGIKYMSKDGSSRNVINPIESIVKNTHLYFSLADRNSVGRALASLADPESEFASEAQRDIIEEIPNSFKVTEFALEEIERTLLNAGIEQEILDDINMEEKAKLFNPMFVPNAGRNEILVWNEGKPKLFKVHDPLLYNEMVKQDNRAANDFTNGILFRTARGSANILRTGITSSPFFTARVFYRSFHQLMVKTEAKGMNYFTQPFRVMKSMIEVNKKSDLFWDWMASGGAQSTFIAVEKEYLEKKMNNYALNRKTKDVLTGRRKVQSGKESREIAWYMARNTAAAPFRVLQRFNETLDQALKLAEYEVMMKQTKGDRIESALASREADVDYKRFGSGGMQETNQIIPFFNVSFQGPDNVLRAFGKHKLRTAVRASTLVILPTILLYLLNRDDEDYQELNSWEKDMNWLIKMPNGEFMKIAVPFETGVLFKTIPEKLFGEFLDFVEGEDKQSWDDFYENVAKTMLPSFLPTIFDIAAKYNAEMDLMNMRPFVPIHLQRLEKEEQYTENTSEVAKWVGKQTGKSPMVIEEAVRMQFGQVGQFALFGADALLDTFGIIDKPSTQGLKDGYVKRYFIASIEDGGTGSITDFYEKYKKDEKKYNTLIARGEDPGDELELTIEAFKKANEDISRLRKLRNDIMFDKITHPDGTKFSKAEKKQQIDIANKGMRDIARIVQGKEPLDPEYVDAAWMLADDYNEYQKAKTKQRSDAKKERKKRRAQEGLQ